MNTVNRDLFSKKDSVHFLICSPCVSGTLLKLPINIYLRMIILYRERHLHADSTSMQHAS